MGVEEIIVVRRIVEAQFYVTVFGNGSAEPKFASPGTNTEFVMQLVTPTLKYKL